MGGNILPLVLCPGSSESWPDNDVQKKFQWPRVIPFFFFSFDICWVLLFVFAWHAARATLHELDN